MNTLPPPRVHPAWRWAAVGWIVFVGAVVVCADRRALGPIFDFVTSHRGLDKVGHFMLMGGLAFFVNLALGMRQWRGMLVGSVGVAVVVLGEEISQLWFPGRTFDLLDLAADLAGILFFGWLTRRVFSRRTQV